MGIPEKKVNILLIDEFFLQRRIIKSLLLQAGYSHVLEVEDGPMAQELKGQEKIDILILSWYRHSDSPTKLLNTLGPGRGRWDLPVFVVLGAEEEKNFPRALRRRVSRFLIKPFSAGVLAGKIQEVLGVGEASKNHSLLRGARPSAGRFGSAKK